MRDEDFQVDGGLRPHAQANQWSNGEDGAPGLREAVSGNRRGDLRESFARLDGFVPTSGHPLADARFILRGRERSSGAWHSDGGAFGTAGVGGAASRLRFDKAVAPNGYAWWYLDAFSADHRYGLTIIAFIGSVFSPYYAGARRRNAAADPAAHCSLNVALYGPGVRRWSMTERCQESLETSASHLRIGPSAVSWDGWKLRVEFDEKAPLTGARVKGVVTLEPEIVTDFVHRFDRAGHHEWSPFAPRAYVDVSLESPALSWSGLGYFDMNRGSEPLEAGFKHWNWSRACPGKGSAIVYDVTRRTGEKLSMGLQIRGDGSTVPLELPQHWTLMRTPVWQMPRQTRCDKGRVAEVVKTLEDTPFYSRSILSTRVLGENVHAMHESLSLDRFRTRWVQTLLPYRMPRVAL